MLLSKKTSIKVSPIFFQLRDNHWMENTRTLPDSSGILSFPVFPFFPVTGYEVYSGSVVKTSEYDFLPAFNIFCWYFLLSTPWDN